MLNLIKLPLAVAFIALALAPTVESTRQRWIPRGVKMENMVVDLGGNQFSKTGSQCKLQDLSNEPILAFSNAQENQTYLAAALSFVVQSPTDTQADTFDPLQLFSGSSIYISYLQTSMESRTEKSTILSSQINPLVPFHLPEPSCDEDILIVLLVANQPHPFLAEDCYVKQFAEMEEDSSKRRDYKLGGFWESAALGEVSAATWITIKNDKAECQKGSESTAGGPQFITISTGSADTTTTTTTTITAASAGASNSAQAAVDGGEAVQTTTITTVKDGKPTTITTTIPASSIGTDEARQTTTITTVKGGKSTTITTTIPAASAGAGNSSQAMVDSGEAVQTTTITTAKDGKPTTITTTMPASSIGVGGESGAFVGGQKGGEAVITTTITSTGTITTVSGSSTITTTATATFVSTITSPASSSKGAVASGAGAGSDSDTDSCDGEPDEGSNNNNNNNNNKRKGQNVPSESASYVTSVKTITKITTNDKGSKVEQVTTTTKTSAIINLQAPVAQAAVAEPATTTSFSGQSSLKLPLPTGLGVDGINNSTNTLITTTSPGVNGNGAAPSAGAAGKTTPPVQTAGAVDTEPAFVAAVLMGSLGGFYFAFM